MTRKVYPDRGEEGEKRGMGRWMPLAKRIIKYERTILDMVIALEFTHPQPPHLTHGHIRV